MPSSDPEPRYPTLWLHRRRVASRSLSLQLQNLRAVPCTWDRSRSVQRRLPSPLPAEESSYSIQTIWAITRENEGHFSGIDSVSRGSLASSYPPIALRH